LGENARSEAYPRNSALVSEDEGHVSDARKELLVAIGVQVKVDRRVKSEMRVGYLAELIRAIWHEVLDGDSVVDIEDVLSRVESG
jgi:hypothetical protein